MLVRVYPALLAQNCRKNKNKINIVKFETIIKLAGNEKHQTTYGLSHKN